MQEIFELFKKAKPLETEVDQNNQFAYEKTCALQEQIKAYLNF